jgi:phosphoadenosine phosphosulfate reductase
MTLTKKVMEQRIKLASRHPTASMKAEEVIAEALKHKVYVAWSGGRCSTVALHLTLQQDPDIPVVFNNTGIEYPETVEYCRNTAEKWGLNYHELKPAMSFWEIVKVYGFPQIRGSSKCHRIRKPMCCSLLKEAPAHKFLKDNHLDGFIDGIRVEESRPRALGIYQVGLYYLSKRDGLWKFHPVALWTVDDLEIYAEKHGFEFNPLYKTKGLPRIGCMPCTGFTDWRNQLSRVNPRLFRVVNDAFQNQRGEPTLWEFHDQSICVEDVKA